MFHILAICPFYLNMRKEMFDEKDLQFSDGQFWADLMTSNEKNKLMAFGRFVGCVLRARADFI